MKRKIKIGFTFLIPISTLFSSASDAGVTFLLFHVGSKAMGMGGAYTAVANDASAGYYNPAGFSFMNKYELMFMYYNCSVWYETFYFLGGTIPIDKKGTIGIGMLYSTGKEIEYIISKSTDYLGKFFHGNFALTLNYGYKFRENIGVGLGFKYIYKQFNPHCVRIPLSHFIIENNIEGQTFAFDFGFLYRFYLGKESFLPYINLGASVLNIGPSIKDPDYNIEEDLPRTFKIGFSIPFYNSEELKINSSFDITKILVKIQEDFKRKGLKYIWWDAFKHFGLEINYGISYIWLGYIIDEDYRRGITYGGGLKFKRLFFSFGTDNHTFYFKTNTINFTIKYLY